MRKGYADTDLGQVHYVTAGEGPVLLVLHATNHSARMFDDLCPLLASDYRVVAPDYPGFGNSDPLPAEVTMRQLADAMLDVLDAVEAPTAHLFGLHTGNKLGALLGAHDPERLDRLVLCGQPHSIIPDEDRRDEMIRQFVADSLHEFSDDAADAARLKAWADLHRQITAAWWNPAVLADSGFDASTADRLARHVQEKLQMRGSLRQMYAANFAYDWSADLPRVQVPSLVLELADADEIDRHGRQGERVASLVPDARVETIADADERVLHDDPGRLAGPVLDFLAG